MFDQLQQRQESRTTFAEPDGPGVPYGAILKSAADRGALSLPGLIGSAALDIAQKPDVYADIFSAAERKQRLVDNAFAQTRATEEAYDRHISIVKDETGVELENPLRGGYAREARAAIQQEVRAGGMQPIDAKGGVPEYQQRIYNQRLAELQEKHPDLAGLDLAEQARQIAREAAGDESPAPGGGDFSPATFLANFAGSAWAGRRDPLYVGSMFAGPTGAVGRSVITRLATAGLFQGFYNAGLSALEQPSVQAWRSEAGLKSGVEPAVENVGLAFLFGLIPGAAFRGLHEELSRSATAAKPAIENVMRGTASPEEVAATVKFADELRRSLGLIPDEREAGALKLGEEMQAADRAVQPKVEPDTPPALHDDLIAAALKRADDLDAPSPEAVAAVKYLEAYHVSPHDFDAFSLEHVGSGTGALDQGHGLNVAQNEEAIGVYREHFGEGAVSYKVRIRADKDHFLDHDKRLSEQPVNVQQAVARLGVDRDVTGAEAYRLIADRLGSDKAASDALREAGIPGIKYLDQAPRLDILNERVKTIEATLEDARRDPEIAKMWGGVHALENDLAQAKSDAAKTHNFVIFDDKLIEITHKNGEPVRPAPDAELQARISEARPQNEQEAHVAADEALDDFGRREGMTVLKAQDAENTAARVEQATAHQESAEPPARNDPLGKVPFVDEAGNAKMLTPQAIAKMGERETEVGMLIRSCK